MDAHHGLIPHPRFGMHFRNAAGSERAPSEKPFEPYFNPLRPGAPPLAFSMMLGLLETLRNAVLSGHEPAPYLIAALVDGAAFLVVDPEPARELSRLRCERGPGFLAFLVSARRIAGGTVLQVAEPSGRTGYSLEQFCRRHADGSYEALPHCWLEDPAAPPVHCCC